MVEPEPVEQEQVAETWENRGKAFASVDVENLVRQHELCRMMKTLKLTKPCLLPAKPNAQHRQQRQSQRHRIMLCQSRGLDLCKLS